MIIVSNTGPLIGLAKLEQLQILKELATEVYVASQVETEALAKPGSETNLLRSAFGRIIMVRLAQPSAASSERFLGHLDEGEKQTIALALTFASPVLLLLDDRAGRAAAQKLGLSVTGLAGLLLLAKRRGLVPAVVPLISMLRQRGYWMSNEVVEIVKKLAQE